MVKRRLSKLRKESHTNDEGDKGVREDPGEIDPAQMTLQRGVGQGEATLWSRRGQIWLPRERRLYFER